MNSIRMDIPLNSPIPQTIKVGLFLSSFKDGIPSNRVFFPLDDGQEAYATAVYLRDGSVVNLESDEAAMGGSIPVDDTHNPPIPRSKEAYMMNPVYNESMSDQVAGIAAYKLVDSLGVRNRIERAVASVL